MTHAANKLQKQFIFNLPSFQIVYYNVIAQKDNNGVSVFYKKGRSCF